jgi:hypothetical protein
MTPTRFARLLFISAVVASVFSPPLSAGDKNGKNGKNQKKHAWTSAEMTGADETREMAERMALVKARSALEEHLATQRPRVPRMPTLDYIRSHLVVEEPTFTGGPEHPENEGKYVAALKIALDDQRFTELYDHARDEVIREREETARGRMFGLGKALAIVLAGLAAVTGYLRLEESTKGFYTAWLRIAAVSFVAAVGAGIWLVS